MKEHLLLLLFLLLLNPVLAVTVRCGTPQAPGDYLFTNVDPVTVRVFINTAGTSITASPNNFDLPPGGSRLVQLRAPTNTYAKLFVTYTDNTNGFSASLECHFYATSGTSSSTTTTTVQQDRSCSSYTDPTSCRNAGCVWMSYGIGYCTESSSSSTTTTTQLSQTTTLTTTQLTTTTQSSPCAGRSFTSCNLNPNCEWVGSYATGYCRDRVSSTTTTTVQTTTTTTTTVSSGASTVESGGGGTSGSSSTSSGSSGSLSSSSGKSTGFYDFPSFVQVPVNGEKTITGIFYAARDLSDVRFQVADIDANWFTISPSSVQAIKAGEIVNLTVKIKVPENANQDSYVFRLVAKSNVNYEKKITLAVTEIVATTSTTVLVTTTPAQKQASTGFFAKTTQLALEYWYLIAIPVSAILILATLPLTGKKSKGSAYMVVEEEQDYRQEFVEIKLKEPEQPKPIEKPVKRDVNEAIRKKVIKEIRERALRDER